MILADVLNVIDCDFVVIDYSTHVQVYRPLFNVDDNFRKAQLKECCDNFGTSPVRKLRIFSNDFARYLIIYTDRG